MTIDTDTYVRANGIDIHYRDLGRGSPLVLLHGGLVSGSDAFGHTRISHAPFLPRLSQHFRVIVPDARGAGRTRHPGGPISASLLSDDVAALINALDLERPVVAGFSEGGLTALLLAIRNPGAAVATISDAGYDMLNPDAPAFSMLEQMLGNTDEGVDPARIEQALSHDVEMAGVIACMKAELVEAQGPEAWPAYLAHTIRRWAHWPGYGYSDLNAISAPTLLLVGDRDPFCTVEEAVTAYRHLGAGDLAVLPATGHELTSAKADLMTAFAARHRHG